MPHGQMQLERFDLRLVNTRQGRANLVHRRKHLPFVGVRQQHDELVAGKANRPRAVRNRLEQHLSHHADGAIAHVMAEAVVDRLEVVDVEHDAEQRALARLGLAPLLKHPVEKPAVEQPAQLIQVGLFRIALHLHENHRHGHGNPRGRDPVAEKLDEHAGDAGAHEIQHGEEVQVICVFSRSDRQDHAVGEVDHERNVTDCRTGASRVEVVRGNRKQKAVSEQVDEDDDHFNEPRDAKEGRAARRALVVSVNTQVDVEAPEETDAHRSQEAQAVGQVADLPATKNVRAIDKEGNRFEHRANQADRAHPVVDAVLHMGALAVFPAAIEQVPHHQHG